MGSRWREVRNKWQGRGCLVKYTVESPCRKCGKPTLYAYDGTLLCVECLPEMIRHDVAVIERLVTEKRERLEDGNRVEET